jgi:hypothetical protein
MKKETILAKAKAESPEFGLYADYITSEFPGISLPMLRELYKHNASAGEYRATLNRIKAAAIKGGA